MTYESVIMLKLANESKAKSGILGAHEWGSCACERCAPAALEQHRTASVVSLSLAAAEVVSCVLWTGRSYTTGTNVIRILTWRFLAFG